MAKSDGNLNIVFSLFGSVYKTFHFPINYDNFPTRFLTPQKLEKYCCDVWGEDFKNVNSSRRLRKVFRNSLKWGENFRN